MGKHDADAVRALLVLYDERVWLQALIRSDVIGDRQEVLRQVVKRQAAVEAKIAHLEVDGRVEG